MSDWAALAATQPRVSGVLCAALATQRMHHAYLLVGPEPATAHAVFSVLAKALVCTAREGSVACGVCHGCVAAVAGTHPDVITISPNDKGLITVEQVREGSARLSRTAAMAPTKVVHIERADAMNPAAQNALLKTLEEPPGPTCFVLTATRLRAMLPTVRSRCLTLRLAPDDRLLAAPRLQEGGIDPALARLLGPIIGADGARAAELVESGALEIVALVQEACRGPLDASSVVRLAADLGGSRERADLALAFVEVALRDALAQRHGASAAQLYDASGAACLGATSGVAFANTVARLQQLRRLVGLHINRTLAVEGVLLNLGGKTGAAR